MKKMHFSCLMSFELNSGNAIHDNSGKIVEGCTIVM